VQRDLNLKLNEAQRLSEDLNKTSDRLNDMNKNVERYGLFIMSTVTTVFFKNLPDMSKKRKLVPWKIVRWNLNNVMPNMANY
jgi:hypothetical protein